MSEHSGHTLGSKRCVGVQSPLTCPDLLRLALAIVLLAMNVMGLSLAQVGLLVSGLLRLLLGLCSLQIDEGGVQATRWQ